MEGVSEKFRLCKGTIYGSGRLYETVDVQISNQQETSIGKTAFDADVLLDTEFTLISYMSCDSYFTYSIHYLLPNEEVHKSEKSQELRAMY